MKNKKTNELETLANEGNVDAMYELGQRYLEEKEYDKSLFYFGKAEQGG